MAVIPLTGGLIIRRAPPTPTSGAMKFHSATIASLLVTMPFGLSAARNGIAVTENDIEFDVDYFDDGRIRPYRVIFWDNTRNLFDFDTSGIVQIIRIGTERYRVSSRGPSHVIPNTVLYAECESCTS